MYAGSQWQGYTLKKKERIGLLSYPDSLNKLRKIAAQQRSQANSLLVSDTAALGCTSAQDIFSQEYLPAFDNSAMDGFAVRYNDIKDATTARPVSLNVVGESAAGSPYEETIKKQEACQIMTGAMIPPGCDSVIKIEDVVFSEQRIMVAKPVPFGNNVRKKGEDHRPGQLVLPKGKMVDPENILILSTFGLSQSIPCYPKIKVALISTGQELTTERQINSSKGIIRNSTGPLLQAKIRFNHLDLVYQKTCSDKPQDLINCMKEALESRCDLLLTTGGVSAGKYDFIPSIVRDLDGKIFFHKTAVKPGKPILCAGFVQDGHICTHFGLPGNPVSTLVGFDFFVKPYLQLLYEKKPSKGFKARVQTDLKASPKLTNFIRGHWSVSEQGQVEVRPFAGQGSHMVKSLLDFNCWIKLAEGLDFIPSGQLATIFPTFHNCEFI